jgi:hypothetical protein
VVEVLGNNFAQSPDRRTLLYEIVMCRGIDTSWDYIPFGPLEYRQYFLRFDFGSTDSLERAEVRRNSKFEWAGKGMCVRPPNPGGLKPAATLPGDELVINVEMRPP